MIPQRMMKTVMLSSLLRKRFPSLAADLAGVLNKNNVPVHWIEHTKDLWCRDFMPVWTTAKSCVQFRFDPGYYKPKKYQSWCTNPSLVTSLLDLDARQSNIVLDGGNIVSAQSITAMTERVFKDNPAWQPASLMKALIALLDVETLVVLPTIPGDITGHADGMLRFVNERTVVLNDFSKLAPKKVNQLINSRLLDAGLTIVTVPNNLHENRSTDDITGDYINFLEIGNLIVLPAYGCELDQHARALFVSLFPGHSIEQVNVSCLTPLGGGLNCLSWCCPVDVKMHGKLIAV